MVSQSSENPEGVRHVLQDNEDGQSELALLLDPCGSLDAEHFSIF